jgi:hypothetical protein
VATLSSIHWRRAATHGGLWTLFAWFGRACDQAAGVLLNPLVVAVFARSLQRDPFRISWIVVGFGLGWLMGTAITPLLQQITIRVMPWIVGGYIVRTAAIVLLTIAVMDGGSTADQRFKSVLICYVAYAIATGIARTARARHMIHGGPNHLWDSRRPLATVGLCALVGIGALAMWSTLSTASLSWSGSFGRIWILAAVALGVATLAAIQEGANNPEIPAGSQSIRREPSSTPSHQVSVSMAISITGIAAISFVEVVAFLLLFDEFRRQTVYLRGGLAFFAVGWIIAHLIWEPIRLRFGLAVLAQAAIGAGAIGLVVALASPALARADWMPETIRGHSVTALLIYAVGLLIGIGISVRRMAIGDYFDSNVASGRWPHLLISAIACLAPLPVGWAASRFDLDWILIGGISLALIILTIFGAVRGVSAIRPPTRRLVRPERRALLPRP